MAAHAPLTGGLFRKATEILKHLMCDFAGYLHARDKPRTYSTEP